MRMSKLFGQTLRAAPADIEIDSHGLLVRSGFIRQLSAGIFSYLPLAKRTIGKIEGLMRLEMNALGGQEVAMPVVNSADIWKETGRYYEVGAEMGRFSDRAERDMVLAMTHEEVVADLVRREIHSYRQLPCLIYHIQTKWRDDPRPRAGLIRVREFTMKDSYSLDATWESLDAHYAAHYQAYFNIFHRCDLPTIAVGADVGMMGGKMAHEFMYLTPIGEDTLILCDGCGYTANRQVATFTKHSPDDGVPAPREKVATPGTTTIATLAEYLGVPVSKTAKSLFLIASVTEDTEDREKFLVAVIRGDMDVNETKLANAVHAKSLRPATEEEIRGIGIEPGYGSPIGVEKAMVVVDDSIPASRNLVAGANEAGHHYRNVNYGRDFQADQVVDIAAARDGDRCEQCGQSLRTTRGVEVANIFKLGTRYSDAMGCTFQDRNGESQPVIMGSYGIGVGRLLACIAEEHHDEHGLMWPVTVAPYHVYLVNLSTSGTAEMLYRQLEAKGVEVLFDDREERAGVKFNDADLIGIPIRVTVGDRSLKQGGVDVKIRTEKESRLVPLEGAVEGIIEVKSGLEHAIEEKVVAMPFKA